MLQTTTQQHNKLARFEPGYYWAEREGSKNSAVIVQLDEERNLWTFGVAQPHPDPNGWRILGKVDG